ncbi:hypothetical protein [Spiroplasma endosymbiont of Virgichneumon dumeticola]|uniref:hypothetical protein n=1 Tax=Spiroplasma endosymbiont of Virgichneumon dumeticola TaxID=3139323 RepID=UPI0035C8D916
MIIKDVPGDGNCILWAVMVSYLEQVKTDEEQFKKRYKALFGVESDRNRIFNFNDFDFKDKKMWD